MSLEGGGGAVTEEDRRTACPRCGGDVYVDADGRRTPMATAATPCVCDEFELPPHWRR
jgi:hypothetical protein